MDMKRVVLRMEEERCIMKLREGREEGELGRGDGQEGRTEQKGMNKE